MPDTSQMCPFPSFQGASATAQSSAEKKSGCRSQVCKVHKKRSEAKEYAKEENLHICTLLGAVACLTCADQWYQDALAPGPYFRAPTPPVVYIFFIASVSSKQPKESRKAARPNKEPDLHSLRVYSLRHHPAVALPAAPRCPLSPLHPTTVIILDEVSKLVIQVLVIVCPAPLGSLIQIIDCARIEVKLSYNMLK